MKYAIYQIKDIEKVNYAFRSIEEARTFEGGPKMEDYEDVYYGYLFGADWADDHSVLDYLFQKFNTEIPEGFNGHSLSVSDIVRWNDKYYYCNPFGWEEVTEWE